MSEMDADRQEALSIRYAVGLRLAKLTSGRWALWTDGLEGLEIVEPEGLAERVGVLGALEQDVRLREWDEYERRQERGWDEPQVVKAGKSLEDMGL